MSIAELEREIASLEQPMQKRLMAFLVSLQLKRDADWQQKTAAKLDDRDSGRWVSLEEAEKRLELDSGDGR